MEYKLMLASKDEQETFANSASQSGLPNELKYLSMDPLAIQARGKTKGYDHVHLSVCDNEATLVQWWGRGSSGYHYPIGPVMKMISLSENKE